MKRAGAIAMRQYSVVFFTVHPFMIYFLEVFEDVDVVSRKRDPPLVLSLY